MGSLLHRAISSAPEIDRMFEATQQPPFTQRILETYVPNVKIRVPTYDGTKDPVQHLTSFMATISKARFTEEQKDAGQCQLFIDSLVENALIWFSHIPPGTIDCFEQLSTAFLRNYRVFIQRNASSAELWEIVQEPDEPLWKYLTRFKEKYATITVAEDVAIAAFKKGLIPGSRLHVDLNIREATDLDEALHRGSRVAYVEEDEKKRANKLPPPRPAVAKEKSRETN
ncbi:PREDICTED: uncharacterized protein LOC104734034 [Camelina sativa]|uniref:Uncharacterized protein LOC104734034 n=1 Tax=Camelina sativa TaxID=90675 RepID=A0ABM0V6W3_CAMSA|nr:PREDICTED: uncharacterized protein LOC104734034 [Camelina sativa]